MLPGDMGNVWRHFWYHDLEGVTGIWYLDIRGADKHPTLSTAKSDPVHNVNSAKIKKHCLYLRLCKLNDALKSKKIHFIFETLEVYMNPEMKKHLLILWCFGFLVFFSMHIYIIVNKMTCLEVLICNSFYLIVPQESCPCHSGLFYNMVFDDCMVFHCMDVMLFITFFPDCRIVTFSNFIYHSQCFDES